MKEGEAKSMGTTLSISRRRLLKTGSLLAAGSAIALLAACSASPTPAPATSQPEQKTGGSGSAPTPATSKPTAAASRPAAKEQVNLRFSQPTDADTLKAWNEWFNGPFKQRNPHITVTVESVPSADHHSKILAQAASRTLPDTMYSQGPFAQQFIKNGIFPELDPFMKADSKFQEHGGIADFFPEGVRPYQANGKTYALPYDFGPACLVYYKPIFDEAGVKYPTNDWTFNDFLEAAVKIAKPGERWATERLPRGDWIFEQTYLRPWGGRLVNDEETEILITSPEAQEALQYWVDLALKHKAMVSVAETKNFDQSPFYSKKVAMTWNGAWQVEAYNKAGMIGKYDVVFMPKGPKERSAAAMGSGYGMASNSQHKDEAWIMIRETTDEGMEEFFAKRGRAAHARKSRAPLALQIPNIPPNAKAWIDAQEHGHMGQPISPVAPKINDVVTRELELLFVGKKSVKECVETIKRECDPLVAQNKK